MNRFRAKLQSFKTKQIAGLLVLVFAAVGVVGSAQFISTNKLFDRSKAATAEVSVSEKVVEKLNNQGKVRVLVKLNTQFAPEAQLSANEQLSQRSAISSARTQVVDSVKGTGANILSEYQTVPWVSMELTQTALSKLKLLRGTVLEVRDDPEIEHLGQWNIDKVRAPQAWSLGYQGTGQTIAIIDSGFAVDHPLLKDFIREEVCIFHCPNGTDFQIGAGVAMNCDNTKFPGVCDHGTGVAGVAVSKYINNVGYSVAKDAKLILIKDMAEVCEAGICAMRSAPASRIIAAFDWLYQNKDIYKIAAVNFSAAINSDVRHTGYCDTSVLNDSISSFYGANIPVVVAAGNKESEYNKIFEPACVRTAIAVTGIDNAGLMLYNSATFHSRMVAAPSFDIGGPFDSAGQPTYIYNGTSFGAPHVSAAIAMLKQADPNITSDRIVDALKKTALLITDTRQGANNAQYPLIQIDKAIEYIKTATNTVGPTTSCTATSGTSTTCNMPATLGISTENEEVLGIETSDTEAVSGEVLQATTQATTYGKMMIATVSYIGDPSIPDLQATSMTYCGATMSRLGGAGGIANYSGQHLEMWYLLQPSGAACPLKVNFTRSRTDLTPADAKDRILTRTVFDNVPNTNFLSGFVRVAGYKSPGSTFLDLRDSGAKNSRFVCSYSNYPNGGQNVVSTSGTGWKQIWTGKVLNNVQSAIGVSDPRTTDGQIMNIKWTGTQSQPWAGICINLMQGATGSTTVPTPPPVPPTSVNLKVNGSDGPITVKAGEPLTMSWTPVSANVCTASGGEWTGGKSIAAGIDGQIALPGSTTYKITCTGNGTASDSVVVKGSPTLDLRINGDQTSAKFDNGIAPTLNWTVAGATSCTASGGWTGAKTATSGMENVTAITGNTTYTLACTGAGGTITKSVSASSTGVAAKIGYLAQYYSDTNFQQLFGTNVVTSINADLGTTGRAYPDLPLNYYSVRYSAQLSPTTTGTYTLTTTSDDGVRVYIDDKPVVVDWIYHGRTVKSGTVAMTAGKKYNLVIEYVETSGGATIIFQAGIAPNPAPLNPKATNLSLGLNGHGFKANFYTDTAYTTQTDTKIAPILDSLWVTAPDTTLPYIYKSVRYGGFVTPTVTSTYTFQIPSGTELYIAGAKKVANPTTGYTHAMTAGVSYPITLQGKMSTFTHMYLRWKYGALPYTPLDFRNVRPSN